MNGNFSNDSLPLPKGFDIHEVDFKKSRYFGSAAVGWCQWKCSNGCPGSSVYGYFEKWQRQGISALCLDDHVRHQQLPTS